MKNIGTKTLETERLILRRWTKEDAKAMYENYASDPQVTKFMSWPLHENIETSEYIVSDWVNSYSKDNYYEWAIVWRIPVRLCPKAERNFTPCLLNLLRL